MNCDFMKSCQCLCDYDLSTWWDGAGLGWSHLIWAGLARRAGAKQDGQGKFCAGLARRAGAKQDGAGEFTGTRGSRAQVQSGPI